MEASPLLTLCAAGAINASFALPMKFMRRWPWENTWFVWSCFALLIFPGCLSVYALPNLPSLLLFARAEAVELAAFGALWGIGQVLFGCALEAIGIALATSIMLGVATAVGTLAPLLAAGGAQPIPHPALLTGAMGLAIGGVGLCALAGRQREGGGRADSRGILCAVTAGVGAGVFNFAMAFGGTLVGQALRMGSRPELAQLAAWTPFLAAGSLANLGYCGLRLRARRSCRNFAGPVALPYWLGGMLMAALWLGSALLYGVAIGRIGHGGAVFAWPVYLSLIVLASAAVGAIAGEWRAASRRTLTTMASGLTVLIVAVFLITWLQHVSR
jgi:L-rhamnose-H+ transport protein